LVNVALTKEFGQQGPPGSDPVVDLRLGAASSRTRVTLLTLTMPAADANGT
jgi:hypothetical protein